MRICNSFPLTNRVQFGWSKANPPDFEECIVCVHPEDIKKTETGPNLEEKFVKQAVDQLVGNIDEDSTPRFFCIVGAYQALGQSRYKVWQLQQNFVTTVFERLKQNYSRLINPENFEFKRNITKLNGMADAITMTESTDGFPTYQIPHFDGVLPIFSLAYGPFKDIQPGEGNPQLTDVRQYCKNHSRKITSIIEKAGDKYIVPVHPEYTQALAEYTIDLRETDGPNLNFENDMPILIINNRVQEAGIAHGATRINSTSGERPLHAVEFDVVHEKDRDRWYTNLGYAQRQYS